MKQKIKYLAAGAIIGATVAATAGVFASNYDDWIDIAYRNIKIVVNGKEIHPNAEPFVSEGTTYLPVRDVADAFGQAVYWDGPNYTVYLGKMDGILDYPSLKLVDTNNIGSGWGKTSDLTDNYGNHYTNAVECYGSGYTGEYLLNYKYSRFRGTIYVTEGTSTDRVGGIVITADGKDIYTSPKISKTSHPISFDVDITVCNDLKIERTGDYGIKICIADGGFYQ